MKSIRPSTISGAVDAPPSKSAMLRSLAAALLAEGTSEIFYPTFCGDALAGLRIIEALGAKIERQNDHLIIHGGFDPQSETLDCGESGLCLRMFAPIAALSGRSITLTGAGSLQRRPLDFLGEPLRRLGVAISGNAVRLPLTVHGPLHGGEVEVDGSISSQLLSGLLFALPRCAHPSKLTVRELKSAPYIRMTLQTLAQAGVHIEAEDDLSAFAIPCGQNYQAQKFIIEGDWSAAAFWLVAGAIGGAVAIGRLDLKSWQADREILTALREAGAQVSVESDFIEVRQSLLRAFSFDATDCPDLVPPLAVLAAHSRGESVLYGVKRLRYKESDRAAALSENLSRQGIECRVDNDRMIIKGGRMVGGAWPTFHDHRLAMAGAVASLTAEAPIIIDDENCVAKSYPDFFRDLNQLTGGEQ